MFRSLGAFISVRKFRLVTSEFTHWKVATPLTPTSVESEVGLYVTL